MRSISLRHVCGHIGCLFGPPAFVFRQLVLGLDLRLPPSPVGLDTVLAVQNRRETVQEFVQLAPHALLWCFCVGAGVLVPLPWIARQARTNPLDKFTLLHRPVPVCVKRLQNAGRVQEPKQPSFFLCLGVAGRACRFVWALQLRPLWDVMQHSVQLVEFYVAVPVRVEFAEDAPERCLHGRRC
jgi:hypothetical protein